jgi:hypothetical protein
MHYRMILNAIPVPSFVVNDDVEILDLNGAAANFCGQDRDAAYRRRGGEVLHCRHSTDVPEGCGRGPHCTYCVIRSSVRNCLEQVVSRKVMNLQTVHERAAKEIQILITASPLGGGEKLALVLVEDLTELRKLACKTSSLTPPIGSPMLRQQVDWHSRPWALNEFPEDTRIRLRQLDFNRTITVHIGDNSFYIRRIGLNQFLHCEVKNRTLAASQDSNAAQTN